MPPSSETKIQVLYEIALAIQPKADVESTVEAAVSTYLQKLNCSGAAAFQTHADADGDLTHELVTTLPEQSQFTDSLLVDRDSLPDREDALGSVLPVVEEVEPGTHRYVMELPDFGALVLLRRGQPLDEQTVLSLRELNEKLATACNRVVVQNQYETQYRELFEKAPVMFVLTREEDGELVISDCNRAFVETLGYSREELQGQPLSELYTEESRAALRESGYDEALSGEYGTAERVFRTREGRKITTLVRATPRRDRNGTVVGTTALCVDVTQLKRRNQQLTVLNRILRHNLRNGLTAIMGHLEMAMDRADEQTLDALEQVADRTQSLISIGEIADHFRQTLAETEISTQNLGSAVREMADRAREEYPDATVEISVQPAQVQATTSLRYALWELVDNACEHGGESPRVTLIVEKGDGTASVTVTDDGPGIPEQERQILQKGEETPLDHGSGLGLWLVFWVVDMSGGEISFECDSGTAVKVTFPAAEETLPPQNLQ